jgi:hypothetical protein
VSSSIQCFESIPYATCVLCTSGSSVCMQAIVTWLSGLQAQADPVTKAPIDARQIAPNLALRSVILDWLWRNFRVRGTPQGGHSMPGVEQKAADGVAGTSSQGSRRIMLTSHAHAHPASPLCSMNGSVFNASTVGLCGSTTPVHRGVSMAMFADAAAQPFSHSTAGGGAGTALKGAPGAGAGRPLATAASAGELLIMRSASDGALQLPVGCYGSFNGGMQNAATDGCCCSSCKRLAAGSSYGLAALPVAPGRIATSLRDRDSWERDGLQARASASASRPAGSLGSLPGTPAGVDGSSRIRSCGQVHHGMCNMNCVSCGSACSLDSMACNAASRSMSSAAGVTTACASCSNDAGTSAAQQPGESESWGNAPQAACYSDHTRSEDPGAAEIQDQSFIVGTPSACATDIVSSVGLRRRHMHVPHEDADASALDPQSPATATSKKARSLARSSAGTPVARHFFAAARPTTLSHEELCDCSHPGDVDHSLWGAANACPDSSTSLASCCSLQQQQHQHMHYLHMHASHALLRASGRSGLVAESCGATGSVRGAVHSQPPSSAGSLQQCMSRMHCSSSAGTLSRSAPLHSGTVQSCRNGATLAWVQEGVATTTVGGKSQSLDCVGLVDQPIPEHFQPNHVHPSDESHKGTDYALGDVPAPAVALGRGSHAEKILAASGIQSALSAGGFDRSLRSGLPHARLPRSSSDTWSASSLVRSHSAPAAEKF